MTDTTAREAGEPAVTVAHQPDASRFIVELDGEQAIAQYDRHGREVHFTHTEVPAAFEGKGVGTQLAKAALDWAVGEGLTIVPQCAFIASYLKRHPEYREHVAKDWQR